MSHAGAGGGVGSEPRRDPIRQPVGNGLLAEPRPILNALGRDEVHGVLGSAEGAGRGRDIVGEDPVAALPGALKAARMSGLAVSSSLGAPPFYLSFCAAGLATAQSLTAAAHTAMSTGR